MDAPGSGMPALPRTHGGKSVWAAGVRAAAAKSRRPFSSGPRAADRKAQAPPRALTPLPAETADDAAAPDTATRDRIAAVTAHLRGTPPPLTGSPRADAQAGHFDEIHKALRRAVRRCSGISLQERWDVIAHHIEAFGKPPADCNRSKDLAQEIPRRIEEACDQEEAAINGASDMLSLLVSLRPCLRAVASQVLEVLRVCVGMVIDNECEEAVSYDPGTPNRMSLVHLVKHASIRRLQHSEVRAGALRMARIGAIDITQRLLDRRRKTIIGACFRSWRQQLVVKRENMVTFDETMQLRGQITALEEQLDAAQRELVYYQSRLQTERADARKRRETAKEAEESLEERSKRVEIALRSMRKELEDAGSEIEGLQGLVDDIVFRDLLGGCQREIAHQDDVLPLVEAWARGTAEAASPRRRASAAVTAESAPGCGRRLAPLIAEWANRCGRPHPRAQQYKLDPAVGFVDPEREMGAMMLVLHRLCPSGADAADVEEFAGAGPGEERAALLLAALRRTGVKTGLSPQLLSAEDSQGLVRMHVMADLLLRTLETAGATQSGDTGRLLWRTEEEAMAAAARPIPLRRPALPHRRQIDVWRPEPAPGRRMPVESWATFRSALSARLGRLHLAGKAVRLSLRREVQIAVQEGDEDAPTPGDLRDVPLYSVANSAACSALEVGWRHGRQGSALVAQPERGINLVLSQNYRLLRSIFRHYACSDVRSATRSAGRPTRRMTDDEFAKLMEDCELTGLQGPPAVHQELEVLLSNAAGLGPASFTDAVVVLAGLPFAPSVLRADSPAKRLELFVTEVLEPRAGTLSGAEFRAMCHKRQSEAVFREWNSKLRLVYAHYACGRETNDVMDQTEKELKEVSYREFKQMMDDVGAADAAISHYALHQVFVKMQDNDDLALTFVEFWEVLCAISSMKEPAPFMPLHTKVRRFLLRTFFPQLQKKGVLARANTAAKRPDRRRSTAARRQSEAGGSDDGITLARRITSPTRLSRPQGGW